MFVFVEESLLVLIFGTYCKTYSAFVGLGYFYVADYSLIGISTGGGLSSRISTSWYR